jgi:poly(3-hydroxybutyrate) depolymerase
MKFKNYLFVVLLFFTSVAFPQTGAEIDRTLTISGNTYKYRIYVPTSYDGTKPVPLLFNIHGFTGSDTQQESFGDFRKIADTANFIIIHPDAKNNSGSWDVLNGTASTSNGDRKALLTMLDTMEARYNINKCKVYTTGFSQGGFMSCYLVSNLDALGSPPRFAAAAPVSGNYGTTAIWNAKNPQNPVPIMIIHGTSDGIIGYPGTGGITSSTHVDTVIKWWRGYDGCTTPYPGTATTLPDINTGDGSTVDHFVYSGGNRGSSVELYRVVGGGHSWPGASANSIGQGNRNLDFNASLVIWQFLSKYCLPYLTSTTCTDAPTISSQPNNSTVCSGNSTSFAVTAAGCVGTALTYQWQVNSGSGFVNLTNSAPYSGVTTSTLTVSSATTALNNYQYRCFVTSCCKNSYSNPATLTVNNCCTAPTISNPVPASRCGTGTVTLGATASAGTINWYAAATGGASIGTGPSFTTPSISATTVYYVDATNNGCTTSSRTAITATISNAPAATISGNATICSGASSIISIALTGSAPWSFTYGSAAGSHPISGITSSTYTTSVTAGTYTLSSVSDASTCTGTVSGSAAITERTPITASTATLTCDGNNANYTATFDITGGDAASYTVNGNAATSHYTSSAIASGTSYSFTVNDSHNCTPVSVSGTKTCSSNTVTCTATAAISRDTTVCPGTSATISIALTGTAPWSITYAIGGVNQTAVSTSSSTYTFTTTTLGVYTLASVTAANSCNATLSGSATIKENTAISVSNKKETCSGNNATYTVEFDIAGGKAVDYIVNGNHTGISGNHYTSSTITSGASYSFTVNDAYNCSPLVVSGTKTCSSNTVVCNATASISGTKTICQGTATTISIGLTGIAPWSITYSIGGVDQTAVSTSVATYTFTTTTAGVYTLASVTDANSCNATNSGSATISTNSAISISNKTETCNGNNTSYVVEFDIAGGNTGSYTVNSNTTGISGNHYISSAISSGTTYSFTVSDSYNCSPVSVSGTKTCLSNTVACNATASMNGNTTICSGTTISIALTGTAPWTITYAIDGTNQTILTNITSSNYALTTSKAGVYTLKTVTDNNNCSATISGNTSVKVNALPAITTVANPSAAAVCKGSNVTLSGAGASNYLWSGNISDGVAFVPTATATYTVTGTDANNCINTATRVVTVFPLPTVGIIATPTSSSICAGDSVKLKGTGAAVYTWSDGIIDGKAFTPIATHTYTVVGTATNTCTNKATKMVTVINCTGTGIEEYISNQTLQIFPNPTDGVVNIVISNSSSTDLLITVLNMFGEEVFNSIDKNIAANYSKQINLNNLAKGVYYLRIKTGTEVIIKKLILS